MFSRNSLEKRPSSKELDKELVVGKKFVKNKQINIDLPNNAFWHVENLFIQGFFLFIEGFFLMYKQLASLYIKNKPWMNK